MLKDLLIKFLPFITLILISCSPKQSEIVVAEYGKNDILMDEFEQAYVKNAGGVEQAKKDSLESYKKFLDLFVNFKMKLRDAKIRNLENDEKLLSELNNYEKSIGTSYLLEKDLYNKGVKRIYDRQKDELRVSHILIRTDSISAEEAEKKALAIIDSIKNGASFEDMAKKYSDDNFSKDKGGDIYYLTAGEILPEFEDLAYETKVGAINSKPLKRDYGFHIIKVAERQKRKPMISASHILIRKNEKVDSTDPKTFAEELLVKIKNGADFEDMAKKYSADPGSAENGGNLGYFRRRQMVQPFDKAAFNLKKGEISDIVETQFGYHIIKLNDIKETAPYEEAKANLRNLYEKSRKQMDYDKLLKEYGKEVNYILLDDAEQEVISNLPEIKLTNDYWKNDFHKNYGNKALFTIDKQEFIVDSLISFSLKNPKNLGKELNKTTFENILKNYADTKILEAKSKSLVKTDPKFASLMDEYKNGIFIFKLQEDEVWNKIKLDSASIYDYYLDTKDSYVLPNRVKYKEIFTTNDSVANYVYAEILNGKDFDTLYLKYNEKPLSQTDGEFIEADKNIISKTAFALKNEGDISEVVKLGNAYSIVKLIEKDLARVKTFEEAKAEVTSAYQDIESANLENAYIDKLKKLYKPKFYYEELKNVFKKD
ncbi:MAG: hypothetical protein CR986_10210 [Ignavibacteriae bacterium]|nr:MAG: hypothetical protein CR986_10210 [Ignavibacteriota bacterium]